MAQTQKLFSSRAKVDVLDFIGEKGRIFYNEDTGELRLSDGVTPHGWPIYGSGGGSGTGTVTSVNASGGTTGLTFTGGPVNTSGVLTLAGVLGFASGGTGATTQSAALTNLLPSQSGNTGKVLTTNGTTASWQVGTNGTVISVNASGGTTGLTFTGGPVTSTGVLTLSGVINLANGGTGATTQNAALTNLLPTQTGNTGKFLTTDGSTASWQVASGGSSLVFYAESGTPTTAPSASVSGTIALGDGSISRQSGGLTYAAGVFSHSGDAQIGTYIARGITTDGNLTQIFLDGTSTQILIPQNTAMSYKINVIGRRTDSFGSEGGVYEIRGGIDRLITLGSTRLIGVPSKSTFSEDNPTWDISVLADTTTGALQILVRGQAGKTIRWVAHIQTVEVQL